MKPTVKNPSHPGLFVHTQFGAERLDAARKSVSACRRSQACYEPRGVRDVDLTDLDRFTAGFPHDVFTRLRREAPVWFHPPTAHTPGGEGFWVVSRHADVVAVASDAHTYSSERGGTRDGGGTLIEDLPAGFAAGVLLNMMDDPRHQKLRRLATGVVSPRALAALEEELRARTAAIVDAAIARGACDFLLDVAAELPLQAVARLLGVPQEDRHRLFAWANATLDYAGRDLGEVDARMQAAQAAMFEYGTWLIAEKRQAPGDDMLSAVVHGTITEADGSAAPPTELEALMFFNLLIAAGSETTRNSLAIGLLALIDHPAEWDALRTDRSAPAERRRGDAALGVEHRLQPPHGHARHRPRGHAASPPATRSRSGGRPRTATRPCFPSPFASTSAASRTATSPSATAITSVSAPCSPGSRCASCSTRCSRAWRAARSRARSNGRGATSTPASATCRSRSAEPPPSPRSCLPTSRFGFRHHPPIRLALGDHDPDLSLGRAADAPALLSRVRV